MNIAKTFRTFSRTGGAINIIRAAAFILLTVPASAQIPPEAKMLELTFQEQERKINDAAFAKYKPELVRLMNECVKNEDFEQAKHIRDILERKSLPGIQEEEKEDYSHFIGQWEETAGGYVYLSRFDGKQAQQKSGNTGWLGKGGVDKDFSSPDIIRLNETRTVWFYWIKTDRDDHIFQVNHATKLVSLLKRKGAREKKRIVPPIPHLSLNSTFFLKNPCRYGNRQRKTGPAIRSSPAKKSREWGVSGHLEAAIWARKRAEGLQKGNHKEKQQLQDITGTWDFPSGTVQIKDPKEFRMEGESMTFEYLRSLNDSVHLFHIQETKQKKW